jgi:hypothetical protein
MLEISKLSISDKNCKIAPTTFVQIMSEKILLNANNWKNQTKVPPKKRKNHF